MKRKLILGLIIYLLVSTANAYYTIVWSPDLISVQCNRWGWIKQRITSWANACEPLEVKSFGVGLLIPSTKRYCQENEAAVFVSSRSKLIEFLGCQQPPDDIKK